MIDIERVKYHLLVEHDMDDVIIQQYIDAAILYAQDYLDYTIIADGEPAENQILLDVSIVQACLLVVGAWYESREDVTYKKGHSIPHGFERLLWRKRKQSA